MADLSMMEALKDKMSRVGGNAFAEYVDDATSELLLAQDPDKIAQLVHFGNQGGEHVVTLLNAVRRRIDHKKAKVQLYTVRVLEALIRSCGRDLHRELVNQKGLLRDLVLIAAMKNPSSEGEFEAQKAAATLVLNCSYWFAEHPDPKVVEALAQLANHARVAGASFEGVTADRDFKPRLDLVDPAVAAASINSGDAAPVPTRQRPHGASRQQSRQRAAQQQRLQQQQQQQQARSRAQQRRHVVVDAIPVKSPPEERLAGMMEAVILMGDLMTQAEAQAAEQGGVPVARNEAVNTVAATVRDDHELLASLLGTGIEMEGRDTVQSISDSQVTVLERHMELLIASGAITESTGAAAAAAAAPDDSDEARAIAASLADAQRQQQQRGSAPPSSAAAGGGGNEHIPEPVSAADTAAPGAPHLGTYRERITRFYEFYNPEKLGDVGRVLEKFAGREEVMMRNLKTKYGEEPMPPAGSTSTAAAAATAPPQQPSSSAPPPTVSSTGGPPGSGRSRLQPELGTYRERVARYFEFYSPDLMSTLDVLLESNAGVRRRAHAQRQRVPH